MDGDDDNDDDGREEDYYPTDDTLSLLVFLLSPLLTIILYGRLRVERGVWDDDDDGRERGVWTTRTMTKTGERRTTTGSMTR